MPKLHINDGQDHMQPFLLSVGWTRDVDVQVGIQINGDSPGDGTGRDLLSQLYGSEEGREALGRLMVHWMATEGVNWDWEKVGESDDLCKGLGTNVLSLVRGARDYTPERDGIWVTLTRRGLNEAVRTLKKAGAQTFGRDEW